MSLLSRFYFSARLLSLPVGISATMYLELVTPSKKLFEGEATSVAVPGKNGDFTMLEHHAPIMSALNKGWVKVVCEGEEKLFEVRGGVIEMYFNRVIILAETE